MKQWYAVSGASVQGNTVQVYQFFGWAENGQEAIGQFVSDAAVRFPGHAFGGLVAALMPTEPPRDTTGQSQGG